MYSAMEIAKWFVNRAADDVENNCGGEYLTHLKLQKLLYYAQGGYLGLKNSPLFKNPIECWTHGPVVPNVYRYYKKYGDKAICERKEVEIDSETENVLEQVYQVFGAYSALKLREMTHNETPWRSVQLNEVIPNDTIKDYFKSNYIQE